MTNPSSKFLLIFLLFFATKTSLLAQESDSLLQRCASTALESMNLARFPALIPLREKSERAIQDRIKLNKSLRTNADEVITIPVVVHVVHNASDSNIGGRGNSNITDEQIQSQIDVLNEDYGNTSGYKHFYTDSLGIDTGIRFKLVTVVRTYNEKDQFSPITDADELAAISPAWVTNRYLNIWVCRLNDRYLGTSQFPVVTEVNDLTMGLSDAEEEAIDALTDGVIIDFRYFGRNSAAITSAVYNLGRTTSHEVGHWLGLIHIWGDRFCGTDHCADTPTAYDKNETTDISCTPVFSMCGGQESRNMIENYMDYSPDACMSVFTNDQKERMHAVLSLSPRRAKLVEYSKITGDKLLVELYPNPVRERLTATIFTPDYQLFTVNIFDQKGHRIVADAVNLNYIDVQQFPSGLYYYKVTSGGQSITKRFVVR